jgi:hypothetical protein
VPNYAHFLIPAGVKIPLPQILIQMRLIDIEKKPLKIFAQWILNLPDEALESRRFVL